MHIYAHRLFLYFALPFGLLFAFLTPPFGGGDEQHHFLRTYEIVTGQWMGYSNGPAGIRQFQDAGIKKLFAALSARHYPSSNFSELGTIALGAESPISQNVNKMFIGQFPLAHILYVPGMAASLALNLKPLAMLYVCRISGMLLSTLLIYLAIRMAPIGGYVLCAIALFPTTVFSRSFMHTDSLMMAATFLFFACLSHILIEKKQETITRYKRLLFWLCSIISPLKTGYALLPIMCFVISKNLFGNNKKFWMTILSLVVPGLLLTLGWLLIVNIVHGDSLTYSTWAGKEVNPSAQIVHMLRDPIGFLSVLGGYIFSISNIMMWIAGIFAELGWSIVYLDPVCYLVMMLGFALVIYFEPARPPEPLRPREKWLVAAIFAGTILAIMTLIYIAFNPVKGTTIASFQGRYFLPLLPFFIWLLPKNTAPNTPRACIAVTALSLFGLSSAALRLAGVYYW